MSETVNIPMTYDMVRNVVGACDQFVTEARRTLGDESQTNFLGEEAVKELGFRAQAMNQLRERILETLFAAGAAKSA